uniref:DNA2/NAM7 helicase-like C-terminal domain-containing protein n=1 Tax=Salix viminalis TaxID=40686 RepID=A0A6N2K2U2_SALVM
MSNKSASFHEIGVLGLFFYSMILRMARSFAFNTVDGFQGLEVGILILSTVRAADLSSSMNGLSSSSIGFVADIRRMNDLADERSSMSRLSSSSIGFVADIRRMNVALTRAKLSLCILGNARTLQTNRN